jgi:hypothetical protein
MNPTNVKVGDVVTNLHEDFIVTTIEDRYNHRSQRREPHVVCRGLIWPVATLTIIAGKITTC